MRDDTPGPGDRAPHGDGAQLSAGARHENTDHESPGYESPGHESPGHESPGHESTEERARQICLRLLTLAPRTRAQLAGALRNRGIPGRVADDVLGRFTDAGLIDDKAFARAWVESRHHGRGLAGRALAAELKQRGVDDEQIREAVDGLGPDTEVATARQLVAARLAATKGQPPQARMRRLAGMLARKGYAPGLAYRVIREAIEAEGTDGYLGEEPFFDDPYSYTE